jgi:hypothetical protein
MTATVTCVHCTLSPATAESLNERIGDFAGLVGLVLVLVTLFTQQRSAKLTELQSGPVVTARKIWTTELWQSRVLLLVTVALFAVGLPIVVECVGSLDPLNDEGPLRAAFTIVWALLVALIFWQGSIAKAACAERKEWDKLNSPTNEAPVVSTSDDQSHGGA